jgi:hypothetical protein
MAWPTRNKNKSFKFKVEVPDLTKFIGKTVIIEGKEVVIKTIVGNMTQKAFYEINSEHLVNMLRFHAQMCGDHSITEQQFVDFENMEMESKEPHKQPTIRDKMAGHYDS